MLRYFVIAAILVLGTAILLSAGWRRPRAIELTSGSATAAPARGYGNDTADARHDKPFIADVAWALSALPECLLQKDVWGGRLGKVLADLPAGAAPIAAPATLHYGDCTIFVRADDALVVRGEDRMQIPPSVRFYRHGRQLLLLHFGASGAQLRTYVPSNP